MLSSSSNFDTENEAAQNQPVWVIDFDGVSPAYYCSGTFTDIDANYKRYLKNMRLIQTNSDLLNFRTQFGGIEFDIIDKDGDILALFSNTFSNRKVTAKIGFQDIAIADFVDLPPFYIVEFGIRENLCDYYFKCRSKFSQVKPIMGNLGSGTLLVNLDATKDNYITDGDSDANLPEMEGNALKTTDGCSVALDAGQAHSGTKSVKLTGIDLAVQTYFTTFFDGDGSDCGLTSGYRYYISVWVYIPAGQDLDKASLITKNNAGAETTLDSTTTTDTWVELTGYFSDDDAQKPLIVKGEDADAGGDIRTEFIYVDEWSITHNIQVANASFSTGGSADWGSDTYVKIGTEVIKYGDKDGTNYLGKTERAQLGTDQTAHSIYDQVTEIVVIDEADHGMTFLLGLLTTTAAGTNGDYDLGRAGWGLELDDDLVDFNQIQNEMGDYGKWGNDGTDDNIFKLYYDSSNRIEDGLDWIEQNILKMLPGYFILTECGKLGIKGWDIKGNAEGNKTITEALTVKNPEIEIRSNDVISHVEIQGDYNIGTTTFEDIKEYELDEGYTIWGEKKRIQLANYTDSEHFYGDTWRRDRYLERMFGRYGNSPVRSKIKTNLECQLIQVGDVIDITNSNVPLFRAATLGWTTEGQEVISVSTDYGVQKIEPSIICENVMGIEEADLQDIGIITSMDDASLSQDANHAAGTLQAADAYVDQSTHTATNVMVELSLEQPGEGGGTAIGKFITFYIKCQNPAGTDIKEIEKRFYYDETASSTIKREFYCLGMAATQFARIRVDWTGGTYDHAPSSITLTKVKFWNVKYNITTTDLK